MNGDLKISEFRKDLRKKFKFIYNEDLNFISKTYSYFYHLNDNKWKLIPSDGIWGYIWGVNVSTKKLLLALDIPYKDLICIHNNHNFFIVRQFGKDEKDIMNIIK